MAHDLSTYKSYSFSHQDAKIANYYKKLYSPGTYAYCIWELEKEILKKIFAKLQNKAKGNLLLDFACGTGRVAQFIAEQFPNLHVYGIDISKSMINIAKNNLKQSKIHNLEYHVGDMISHPNKFKELKNVQYITAFRFFLNAEPQLREAALSAFRKLNDQHFLIFNIHALVPSLIYLEHTIERIKRLRNPERKYPLNKLSHIQVKRLLARHGYKIEQFIPVTWFIPRLYRWIAKNHCKRLKMLNSSFLLRLIPTQAIYIAKPI